MNPSATTQRCTLPDDPAGRRLRGRRIVEVLREIGHVDVGHATLLDVGCSTGLIAKEIANHVHLIVGIDIDGEAIRAAGEPTQGAPAASFLIGSALSLPFADEAFDAAICNHVYEHVPDPYALMDEIRRVLRPGGVCYFAAGHTLQVIEPHHRLPFLSWLPRRAANAWVRMTRRESLYEEKFLPPWRLRSLFRGFAAATLISPAMLRAPQRYELGSIAQLPPVLRFFIAVMAQPLALLAPTWIWLLKR